VGGQHHAPAALPPGKTRYPLYRRLGGPKGRSGRVRKISPPTRIRSPDRPARSQSLYRLSYLTHINIVIYIVTNVNWVSYLDDIASCILKSF
jgi:hypothetical protein